MYGVKSREGRWSAFLCDCSRDAVHFHYGNVVLHISLEDIRALGVAMQAVADGVNGVEAPQNMIKRGLVQ